MALKGHIPWNKGTKGLVKSNAGSFKKGRKKAITAGMKKGHHKEPMPDWWKEKIARSKKGSHHSIETRNKMRFSHLGEKTWNYITDRSKLKKQNTRNDQAYCEWRKNVWIRDNFKCRIANQDCKGRIEAHHILGWTEFVELRYKINNGITLCHAHHPRRRAEEKRLIPILVELVSVSKE